MLSCLEMKRVNWWEVFIFFFVAVTVSAPFRLGFIDLASLVKLPFGLSLFFYVLRGIGPAIGFLVIFYVLRSQTQRTISFWGRDKIISFVAVLPMIIGLTIVGIPNNSGLNDHYFGLLYGLMLVLYSLGEEFGWRGYLQEASTPLPKVQRIFLIATLWFLWHLNFLRPEISFYSHAIHYASLVAGAWGLMKVTEISGSILFASAVHLSFNILSDVPGNFNGRLVILIVSVAIWVYFLRKLAARNAVIK